MADLKPQRYKDERPADEFLYLHEWTRTHPPGWTYVLVRLIVTWIAIFIYRTRGIASENVPSSGPLIFAANHASNMDHFFAGVYTRRKLQFMAKSQLFHQNRILDYIFRVGGVFPVMRGHHDENAFITANAILERGGCVLMYPEGGRTRTGELGEPRAGVGKLALESGVPVVPVAIHGSIGVRRWRKLQFPKVTVQYGQPLTFEAVPDPTREQQLDCANKIFDRVREMYNILNEQGRGTVIRQRREVSTEPVAEPPPGPSTSRYS
jgi:1-acyl-sn-glycerol-3-phosphate acyltransferase